MYSLLGIGFLSGSRILHVLRVLHATRSLRSISTLQGLQTVMQTVIYSIPGMSVLIDAVCPASTVVREFACSL